VLPTSGSARFSSPLGVYDFQKRTSLIKVSKAGAQTLGRIASTWRTVKACRRTPGRLNSGWIVEPSAPCLISIAPPSRPDLRALFWAFRRSASPALAVCCPLPGGCWSKSVAG
jgi:hypothetical protein